MAEKKRLKMSNSREVRRAVSRVANMVLNGELTAKDANAILYAANVTLSAIRLDELEQRLEVLEQAAESQQEAL
jgi:hypothetical protein